MVSNDFGEVRIFGYDLDGNASIGWHSYPTYTCGHCSKVVVMRDNRIRPRVRCTACVNWLCEQNEICMNDCTPLRSLAEDHFEGHSKWNRLVPAIMGGATSVKEGVELGLIDPTSL